MKKTIIILFAVVSIFSCQKDASKENSIILQDQEWFKELQVPCDENSICMMRINKALYQEDTVYYSIYVGALCDMVFSVSLMNLEGEVLKTYSGPDDLEDFNNEVTIVETVYSCTDNKMK
ncbi:hypothetical protein [Saccharicrinis aurantiacus]|uniref:hypothetical protein n=1 Tax=Saccharicrinis aurantiacus TaxID=1849719 RepID=UPI00248F837C|nr:hypothetical protein [Saccharicrinis aurantiacus]